MSDPERVGQLLIRSRHGILAYIRCGLPEIHAVEDVFQEVSKTALEKAQEYREGTDFPAWARAIARFKILEWFRSRRGRTLNDEVLKGLDRAFTEVTPSSDNEERKEALRQCLETLPDKSRRILQLRYVEELTPGGIADRMDQTRPSINSALQRIRESLRLCAARRLGEVGT